MTLGYQQRLGVLTLLVLGGVGLLLARLFWLQVVDHDRWALEAEAQVAYWKPVHARRGRILDAQGEVLAADEAGFDLVVRAAAWEGELYLCRWCGARRYQRRDEEPIARCPRCRRGDALVYADRRDLRPVARTLDLHPEELRARITAQVTRAFQEVERALADVSPKRRERRRAWEWADHGWRDRRIARDVPYEVAREVELHVERNPAFRIRTVHTRSVDGGRPFVHVVGRVHERVRELAAPDGSIHRYPTTRGELGIEGRHDVELRGLPGWLRIHEDPRTRESRVLEEHPPVHGLDVRLTIASADQRAAISAMRGTPGAFVVVDARTGAVLAIVSEPGYEPGEYAEVLADVERRRKQDPKGRWPRFHELRDLASNGFFVPGSVYKPFTAVAALTTGLVQPDTEHVCDGYMRNRRGDVIPNGLRCNGQHGPVRLHEGLVSSCNIYFEWLVARMIEHDRFDHFVATGRRFGFGRPTGLETERTGLDDGFRFDFAKGAWWAGAVMSGIGQGTMQLTPAQVARAYAALATGRLPRLHLVARIGTRDATPPPEPLDVDASLLDAIRAALREVPGAGTARGYGLHRWEVACKTGTAEVSDTRDVHNAWLAGFAPEQHGRPPIAFAMVVRSTPLHGADACGPRVAEFLQSFYGDAP